VSNIPSLISSRIGATISSNTLLDQIVTLWCSKITFKRGWRALLDFRDCAIITWRGKVGKPEAGWA